MNSNFQISNFKKCMIECKIWRFTIQFLCSFPSSFKSGSQLVFSSIDMDRVVPLNHPFIPCFQFSINGFENMIDFLVYSIKTTCDRISNSVKFIFQRFSRFSTLILIWTVEVRMGRTILPPNAASMLIAYAASSCCLHYKNRPVNILADTAHMLPQ